MAIPSAPANLIQATLDFTDGQGGSDTVVTHDFELPNGIFLTSAVADDWMIALAANVFWTANVSLEQVRLRRIQTDESAQSTQAAVVGNQGPTSVTINTAMLVRKDVLGVGGRQQGRMFYMGISPGNVNFDGTIPSNIIANLQPLISGAYSDLLLTVGIERLVTTQYNRDAQGRIIDFASVREVSGWTLQPKLATQRRRMRR